MANYAVRVQLMGDPTAEEYETLHAVMSTYGLNRTLNGVREGQDVVITLPHGMYYGQNTASQSALLSSLRADIKAQVQQQIKVFVVTASSWTFGE